MTKIAQPILSIVIPTYNVASLIDDCLTSIMTQKVTSYEVIIIDDGSSDQTVPRIKSLIKSDPRFSLEQIENSGPGRARNIGLSKVKGKYVMFLDSDDKLSQDSLAILLKQAETKDADLVIGKTLRFDETKSWEVPSHQKYQLTKPGIKSIVTNSELFYAIGPAAKLFSRELITGSFFDETKRFAEDQAFIFQSLIRAKKIMTVDTPVYYYRVRSGQNKSLTQTYGMEPLSNLRNILDVANQAYLVGTKQFPNTLDLTKVLLGYYNRLSEIELRSLFKANLRSNEQEQTRFFQLMVCFFQTKESAAFLIESPHFWQYIIKEQLQLFFLVKPGALEAYLEMLARCQESHFGDPELSDSISKMLKLTKKPYRVASHKLATLIKYVVYRILRRK